MYESITQAQESIYLEMYIFEDTVEKYPFFDLLKKRASD
jgi:phosphatidylserine/phosphatidylglycerophosphate/cardiolipin synthase-like enzyme